MATDARAATGTEVSTPTGSATSSAANTGPGAATEVATEVATGTGAPTRAEQAATEAGLAHVVTRHGPVSSLAEAAAARGLSPEQVVKTIVVRLAEDEHRFVLVPGGREIAWPRLRALLGVNRLSLPPAEEAREVTGYERGSITPLGSLRPLPVVADERVRGTVSIGGGAPGVALTVDAEALIASLDAVVADVTRPQQEGAS